jgi:uncharacterized protein YqgC (DUF456 family)
MSFDASLFVWLLAAILIFLGLAGLILPLMPGAPLLFLGLVVAAWAEDFQYVSTWGLVTMGFLALLTYLVDIAAGALGAKKFGASKQAIYFAAAGAVVGIFFGPLGILLGPFFGALIGELIARKDLLEAGSSGIGATVGLLLGAVAKLMLALSMLLLFALLRFY